MADIYKQLKTFAKRFRTKDNREKMNGGPIRAEETLMIETPERVVLEFSLASIGNRFLAVAIDHFIQYFTIIVVAWLFYSFAGFSSSQLANEPDKFISEAPKWTIAVLIVVLFLIFAAYFTAFEWLWSGQTPGKRLMKLRVIRDDGRPITLWEAIARNLLRVCDAVPGFVLPVYSVGLIAIFLSSSDQRIGDLFAGTVVIREREEEAPSFAETFSSRIADPAFTRVHKMMFGKFDVNVLSESQVEVVERFLRRRWDLTERQRTWMAWRIALPLMYKLKPSYDPANFAYEGFLEEVLHSFHANRRYLN